MLFALFALLPVLASAYQPFLAPNLELTPAQLESRAYLEEYGRQQLAASIAERYRTTTPSADRDLTKRHVAHEPYFRTTTPPIADRAVKEELGIRGKGEGKRGTVRQVKKRATQCAVSAGATSTTASTRPSTSSISSSSSVVAASSSRSTASSSSSSSSSMSSSSVALPSSSSVSVTTSTRITVSTAASSASSLVSSSSSSKSSSVSVSSNSSSTKPSSTTPVSSPLSTSSPSSTHSSSTHAAVSSSTSAAVSSSTLSTSSTLRASSSSSIVRSSSTPSSSSTHSTSKTSTSTTKHTTKHTTSTSTSSVKTSSSVTSTKTTTAAAATSSSSSITVDPQGTGPFSGYGTWFYDGLSACGTRDTDTMPIVAVSAQLFDNWPGYNGLNPNNNPICQKHISITWGGKTILAEVTDRCPGCAYRSLDLSIGAFQQFADLSVGEFADGYTGNLTWSWVSGSGRLPEVSVTNQGQ